MKTMTLVAVLGFGLAGAAFADDAMTRSTMTKHEAMKDCIEQQKTANMSMSKSEMKRICKDKLKQQKATGEMPEKPPVDAPQS